jgi:hypothetical protein
MLGQLQVNCENLAKLNHFSKADVGRMKIEMQKSAKIS